MQDDHVVSEPRPAPTVTPLMAWCERTAMRAVDLAHRKAGTVPWRDLSDQDRAMLIGQVLTQLVIWKAMAAEPVPDE